MKDLEMEESQMALYSDRVIELRTEVSCGKKVVNHDIVHQEKR